MDHVWITEYATTCGIRPKYILIHDQIHVSVRGVSSPNWGGIMTMPNNTAVLVPIPTQEHGVLWRCDESAPKLVAPKINSGTRHYLIITYTVCFYRAWITVCFKHAN